MPVLRNILGLALIAAGFVVGPLLPGPGFIPLFLAGLALMQFPGKRRLVARILSGRPLQLRRWQRLTLAAAAGLFLPIPMGFALSRWWTELAEVPSEDPWLAVALYAAAVALVGGLTYAVGPWVLNLLLRWTARSRRGTRRWLRRRGFVLLPPRRARGRGKSGKMHRRDERIVARASRVRKKASGPPREPDPGAEP